MSRIYFAITFAYEIYFNNRPICLLLHFVINCEYAEAKTQKRQNPMQGCIRPCETSKVLFAFLTESVQLVCSRAVYTIVRGRTVSVRYQPLLVRFGIVNCDRRQLRYSWPGTCLWCIVSNGSVVCPMTKTKSVPQNHRYTT